MYVCCLLLPFLCLLSGLGVVSSSDDIIFLALGDWGKKASSSSTASSFQAYDAHDDYDTKTSSKVVNQIAIAGAMSRYALSSSPSPSFVLALGDNFYDKGVQSSSDTLFSTMWEQVYMAEGSGLRVPWHPVFGNHDYGYGQTGLRAQVDRTHVQGTSTDGLWQFPAFNYSLRYMFGKVSVAFVFIDTTTLAPSENKATNENGGISVEVQQARINDQLLHIEEALIAATTGPDLSTWLIMCGHYPIFGVGSHGDTDELLQHLHPLIEQYGVDAYLSGHDHLSSHLHDHGTHYFVAGAGSMIDYAVRPTSAPSMSNNSSQETLSNDMVDGSSSSSSGGGVASISAAQRTLWIGEGFSAFAALRASSSSLNIEYIDQYDNVVYSYEIKRGGSADVPGDGVGPPGDDGGGDNGDGGGGGSGNWRGRHSVVLGILSLVSVNIGLVAVVVLLFLIYIKVFKTQSPTLAADTSNRDVLDNNSTSRLIAYSTVIAKDTQSVAMSDIENPAPPHITVAPEDSTAIEQPGPDSIKKGSIYDWMQRLFTLAAPVQNLTSKMPHQKNVKHRSNVDAPKSTATTTADKLRTPKQQAVSKVKQPTTLQQNEATATLSALSKPQQHKQPQQLPKKVPPAMAFRYAPGR